MTVFDYLSSHISTNKELQIALGSNQKAIARQLHSLRDKIVKIPNGRSPKYALTTNAFGVDDKINLLEVDLYGKHTIIAVLRPLSAGGFFLETFHNTPKILLGEAKNGLFADLPFFLDDMRPQGFLGRRIAKEIRKKEADFSANPALWHTNQVGTYLLANNDDVKGNLKFGTNLRMYQSFVYSTRADYSTLAQQTTSGNQPMSSIGGERPKFNTYCTEKNSHVIVKFSPQGDEAAARRWKDVLITEYHAAQTLKTANIGSAEVALIEADQRLFLESKRFDRQGEFGRSSMFSLLNIDAEFTGVGDDWVRALEGLYDKKILSDQDLHNGKILAAFGQSINNTDMHLGNLSLGIQGDLFTLLPIYDMCSMGFAPAASGEVNALNWIPPTLVNLDDNDITFVKKLAHIFWVSVEQDSRISPEFRLFIQENIIATYQNTAGADW